jgi:steroid delta-isomerase-like uncharacterized protein
MFAQENKTIIRQWVAHWNTRDLEAWIRTVDPQCSFPVLAASGAAPTLDGYKQFCMTLLDAFPDWNETIEEIVAEDDLVMMLFTSRGTHRGAWRSIPASNKPVTITSTGIYRLAGGKIVELRFYPDRYSLLQQMGVLPS